MGNLCGGPTDPETQAALKRDRDIAKILKAEKKKLDSEIKLLLLGAGESGKSTIFKQMKIIHEDGFNEEERRLFKDVIYGNILSSIRVLINAANTMNIPFKNEEAKKMAESLMKIPETQIVLSASSILTPELGKNIKTIWEDEAIQKAFDRRSEYQLTDSADYYLDAIERIAQKDYIPTEQDVLRSRVKTVGIVEADFMVEGYKFKMVDVGGQRNERRKWIHCFDDVTAIIFVTSLSEYDQKLFEDEKMNRMEESLNLFEEIINCRYFKNTPIIVFYNKKDLFQKKIQKVDLKVCFKDYTGGCDYDKALAWIQSKFKKLNQNEKRPIFEHVTCATDTNNVRVVFDAVRQIILQQILELVQI